MINSGCLSVWISFTIYPCERPNNRQRNSMSQASALRAVLYALGANSGILIAKGVAAAVTGSSAMLAEAIHSAADCGNQVLLLFGMKDARRAPDAGHPLGYGRAGRLLALRAAARRSNPGGA